MFRFFVTCYLTCILCRNAVGGSALAKIFSSINNISELDTRMSEICNTRTVQSIETEIGLDGIILKDDGPKLETSQESPLVQDLLTKTRISSNFKKARCSRYCIEELEAGKGFEDINLFLSFADENEEDYFSLRNSTNLKILKYTPTDNKTDNSTILDNCRIYLNLHCDIVNMERERERNLVSQNKFYSNFLEFNREKKSVKIFKNYFPNIIPEFSEKLMHRTNLSGYTEINFNIDANVTGIVINIFGNLTRAVLEIPAHTHTSRTIERPTGIERAMLLASTYDTTGVAIGARNLPGRLCVKLTGVENSKYNFDVITNYETNEENLTRGTILSTTLSSRVEKKIRENTTNSHNNSILINSPINRKPKFIFERSAEIMDPRRNDDEIMADDFSDISLSSREFTAAKNIINYFVPRNNSPMSYGEFKILPKNKKQEQKIQARSSEVASLNEDIDVKMKSSISQSIPMQMADSDQNQKILTQFSTINEDPFERKKILLDVNANSNLIAAPGTTHRVVFDATNNCVLPVRYAIRARSSPFGLVNILPRYMWLTPGQTDHIAVDILIPLASQDTINTLTVFIDGTEIMDKTVNVYVQNAFSKNIDNVKPKIEYFFNNNCAGKLDKDDCEKTFWSADITVQDNDSGLKRVISVPNQIYQRMKYISGTKELVTFYYSSTCCTPTATITAIDVSENQYTRTIDVTKWDNLSQGEIAAIVLGALLLLFLLVLLVIAIVYCVRKKSSHDLPYTQRYGSRQPPRSERTSF